MKSEKLLQYSIELSLLTQLLQSKLITENEYQKIKQKLMKEYKITSDLTAMIA
nr:SHOCT domain-containing protein [Schaedlerella arabinosiphila]